MDQNVEINRNLNYRIDQVNTLLKVIAQQEVDMAAFRQFKDDESLQIEEVLSAREASIKRFLEQKVYFSREFKQFFTTKQNGGLFTAEPFDFYGGFVRINED